MGVTDDVWYRGGGWEEGRWKWRERVKGGKVPCENENVVDDDEDAHLNLSGGHLEFLREIFAPRRVGLLVVDKHAFQDLELGGGGALASLDGVGHVCVEHFGVYLCRIHAGWNKRGNVGAVVGCGYG